MIENIILGFTTIASFNVVLAIIFGSLFGYIIGAIPGLTPSIGIALLIPVTFGMEPTVALSMLVALYVSAEYGGGVTAILLNAPGTPAAVATAFDGYPMSKKGQTGEALALSITASGFGAFVSTVLLIFTAVPVAHFALRFGPYEYFSLALFGLCLITSLSDGSLIKGFIALFVGLILITIGIDPINGVPRFTYITDFFDGIPFLPVLIGLFALSEVFFMLENNETGNNKIKKINPINLGKILSGLAKMKTNLVRSSILGYIIGVIPGAGATIASIISYNEAKRFSSADDIPFGTGNPNGIVASESANNAAVSGALAPLLSLGIPGSASTAIMIGALVMQGLQPGPLLFDENPEIPYSIFATLLIITPFLITFGLIGAKYLVNVALIPKNILAVFVAGICILGSYAYSNSVYSIWIMFCSGFIGYFLRKFSIPTTPIVLAMVLGFMMEVNLRRGLIASDGNFLEVFTQPIASILVILSLVTLFAPFIGRVLKK